VPDLEAKRKELEHQRATFLEQAKQAQAALTEAARRHNAVAAKLQLLDELEND